MEWPSKSDPFIAPHLLDLFDGDLEVLQAGQKCQVIQNQTDLSSRQKTEKIVLADDQQWQTWTESRKFARNEDYALPFPIDDLPRKEVVIICIPRAKGIQLANKYEESGYTDLPLSEKSLESWRSIVKAFHLPGHFPMLATRKQTSVISIARTHKFGNATETLWMHTVVTNPDFGQEPFAMASTHFEERNLTLGVMFGCSDLQVERIKALIDCWEDATEHPFLMLGISAELQLDRAVAMVHAIRKDYKNILKKVEREAQRKGKNRFGWEIINEVRSTRERSREIEEEVGETKRQLSKARLSALDTLQNRHTPILQTTEGNEITYLISERFNDIIERLGSLGVQCQIISEGITFTSDIIRNELSRQESQAFTTGFSLVAMIYLPLTTMATIFAMPIFQWSNDWRNLQYQPVGSGSASSNSNLTSSNEGTAPPVVSGYIWIYVGTSIGLSLITFFGFRIYMKVLNGESTFGGTLSIFDLTRSIKSYKANITVRVRDIKRSTLPR